jgi:alkylated DNA repair dioxygenase AlkB
VTTDQRDLVAVHNSAEFERIDLGAGSWVDVVRGWLVGSDLLYQQFSDTVAWRQGRIYRYDHYVDEPRLGAGFSLATSPHAVLLDAQRALQHRYQVSFPSFALAWYRDGRDSVAFHRDREMRWLEDTVICVLTLGARRSWKLRPRASHYQNEDSDKGATLELAPSGGDLIVMGGRCQADWEHSVPKSPSALAGRMSVQWRWTSRRGRPEIGANYSAPRFYGRS